VIAALCVNELDTDAHSVTDALNAAFQDIANVQLAADLLQIDVLAFVGEGRVAPDHGEAAARQISREALGYAINEILLFRVAGHVGEG
jgi:hypothetical protein